MKRPRPLAGIRQFVRRRRQPAIREVVREPTAGGVIFRHVPGNPSQIDILLIQDSKGRWTIPKGHIEEGETARAAAEREITEETGLARVQVLNWLGKINFRYRRQNSLVLMTTEIFLVKADGNTAGVKAEEWMNNIRWFNSSEALDKIEYDDIGKLILVALKTIRDKRL